MKAKLVQQALQQLATTTKARASAWFFKTGKGQYGYGDQFRGVTVPEQRKIVKQFKDLPLAEIDQLLKSKWHEDRLTAILILVQRFQRSTTEEQKILTKFYLQRSSAINNWDIVDSSAAVIVGQQPVSVLKRLAKSKLLWDRRIAIIATYHAIKQGKPTPALTIAKVLLHDDHDLIQKAVGWMLREVGNHCSQETEMHFLDRYYKVMPRTMLRYAIEKFPEKRRLKYLKG